MGTMTFQAPAKINLHLSITGTRKDGYHLLKMIMVPVSLFDDLTIQEVPNGIEIICDNPAIPLDNSNLVWKAADAIIRGFGIKKGVRATLSKKIPLGGGLGGGSSDAAAMLKGLNSLWNLKLSFDELASIGVRLGADVPFFCQEGPAICEGVGEVVKPIKINRKLFIILINPNIHVSTPWAYKEWDLAQERGAKRGATIDNKRDFVLTEKYKDVSLPPIFDDLRAVMEILHNDLEFPVFGKYEEIKRIKSRLIEVGAKASMMTGSGSTVFGLFETEKERERALKGLDGVNWKVFPVNNLS